MAKSSRYRHHRLEPAELHQQLLSKTYAESFQSFHNIQQGMAITQTAQAGGSVKQAKKSWSQRLKLNNGSPSKTPPDSPSKGEDKHNNNNHLHPVHYVNPMIYGTVRGVPAPRLDAGGLMLRPIPMEVAVVVCSCPEYLSGTKRNLKKASICKKCRGSRLPLAPLGGTVRAPRPAMSAHHFHRPPPATIQITGIKKRPSIFNMANDPYDQIRRSRLTSPEVRAAPRPRSLSPKNRKRSTTPKSRSQSATKPQDWPVQPASISRQSILNCDINPYELLEDQNSSNEDEDLLEHADEILQYSRKYERVLRPPAKVPPDYEAIEFESPPTPKPPQPPPTPPSLSSKESSPDSLDEEAPKRPPRRAKPTPERLEVDSKTPKSILKRSGGTRESPEATTDSDVFTVAFVEVGLGDSSRKKVQFLASNQIISGEEDENEHEEENEASESEKEADAAAPEDEAPPSPLPKASEIKRSNSDRRTSKPPPPPTFLDTWALRQKPVQKPSLNLTFAPAPKEPEDVDIESISSVNRVQEVLLRRPQFNRESSVRLEVRQDETEHSESKTSIMISGNECYSTINVDSTPLYRSSVLVNEPQSPVSESNTVTINVSSNNVVFNDSKTSKTVITVCDDSSDLDQILKNPVEAVKRNLVPHVCGRDDSQGSLKRKDPVRKLLEEPSLKSLIDGLEEELISKLIENSLKRLKQQSPKGKSLRKLIDFSLQRIQDEGLYTESDRVSLASTLSSANSYGSAAYELMEYGNPDELSDCYHSCSSDVSNDVECRSKFYQLLLDATLSEIESNGVEDHAYESINGGVADPIYEEIDVPPPLPQTAPPDTDGKKKSIFEGASKYDILSYLVDAKERGIPDVDDLVNEDETKKELEDTPESRVSAVEIERNDSGVGSETSKSSRSRWQSPVSPQSSPIHLCEDCFNPVERQLLETGTLVCRKCGKRRIERKEIIAEIFETELKYGKDLQIILEEFYRPMLVAGLLTPDQLSAIFLNTEELLENTQMLGDRIKEALEAASQQDDEDLLTVNMGRIFLDTSTMLHAFESYCVRQGAASLLLANLEKEKELLRIFLRVSQMENCILRRMNLNSFLMVPVQRVTKYPLLLSRLHKVTPGHVEGRELIKQALDKIELHLNHMNQEAKDVPTKLWRRIASSSVNCKPYSETEMINIKLRKMSVDVLDWNQDEVNFPVEGKLFFTQPTDYNWKRGRTIKLSPANALLVTNGKPTVNYKATDKPNECIHFPKSTGIREACLLLFREKSGRYSLVREPLYLDRCIVCREADIEDYFEVQEISTKDTFIFKAEVDEKTKFWYTQLQYHSQGMGTWRKRRNALANIMINGMMTRT